MSYTIVIALQKTVDALADMVMAHESMCDKVDKLEQNLQETTKLLEDTNKIKDKINSFYKRLDSENGFTRGASLETRVDILMKDISIYTEHISALEKEKTKEKTKYYLLFKEIHALVDADGHLSDKQAFERIKDYLTNKTSNQAKEPPDATEN
jgi:hypothetical protein